MFNKGDYVVYSNSGICRVEDFVLMCLQNETKECYLLIPVNEPTAKIYLPKEYDGQRIRMAMNKEQALELLDKIEEIPEISVANEKDREKIYKNLITTNDPYKMVSVLKTISRRKKERELSGKKRTSVDDRYFKVVETQLYNELAQALQVNKEMLEQMLYNKQRIK